jgi:solute carrier family 25 (mitochondrial oxoglutarate transporter), member 11
MNPQQSTHRRFCPTMLATSSSSSSSTVATGVVTSSASAGSATAVAPTSPNKRELSKVAVFATSGIGGTLGWAIVHPFNTIAVRMNLTPKGQTFSLPKMISEHGILSLYAGIEAGMLRQIFYATSRFGLFEVFRDKLHDYRGHTDFAARVGIGAITGGMAAYISCPMEVCVVRMANDSSLPIESRKNYTSVVDVASRIVKHEGPLAFWRGSNPFVARAMMVGVFQVATMDQFKDLYSYYLRQKKDSVPNVFCSAMTAGLIYSIATMPLEACKNRMASQVKDVVTGQLPYKTIFQTLKKVSSEEGFLALYNGFIPYYLRCGGHTVAMFVIVQVLRDYYQTTV